MWKTGLPVRSAVLKPHAGQLVLRWVTTWESWLLIVFVFLMNTFVRHGVGVLQRREEAERVADDLHHQADEHGAEVPCFMADKQPRVRGEGDGEESDAQYAEC